MDEQRSPTEPARAPTPKAAAEPPYQAVAPNLDRLSRDSLKPGSVSRRRIGRAAIGLLIVVVVVAGLIIGTLLG
ncbi:hypothetical protein ACFVTX_15180 [Agromyces sp. NPDC058136]|uniref:hypothetical protein n=1 Tax=Agromyces sp. NPDC058136 TaxID=3346354 RepID=UPI0036D85FFE